MRIAISSVGDRAESKMEARFGRAPFFMLYDEDDDHWEVIDNRDSGKQGHGAGPKAAQKLFDAKTDILVTGNGPGGNAARVLQASGIDVYLSDTEISVKKALDAFRENNLKRLEL